MVYSGALFLGIKLIARVVADAARTKKKTEENLELREPIIGAKEGHEKKKQPQRDVAHPTSISGENAGDEKGREPALERKLDWDLEGN